METSLIGKALGFGPNECRFESCVSNFMPYDPHAYTINHVNITLSRKRLYTKIRYTKKTIQLIHILHKIGFLKNYLVQKIHKRKIISFTIFFYKNTAYYHHIRLVSTQSKKFFISLNALRKLQYSTKNSIFLLSTSLGIITHHEALERNIGGLLLCSIV